MIPITLGIIGFISDKYTCYILFNVKSHATHKLLDNIDFDCKSILFIIEKKKNHITVFHICKDIRQKPIL